MLVVIHGAGPAGCTAARLLAEKGHEVTVLETRDHVAGNTYDYMHEGVLIHKYGPHLFHTNNDEVVEFLSRFTEWRPYKHKVKAITEEGVIDLPIVDTFIPHDMSVLKHPNSDYYYNLVYRDYSFKQWGYQPPKEVLDRVMIKCEPQEGYFTDKFQALPKYGYTVMFGEMLNHPNITVELDCLAHILPDCDLRVWTGKVDEYYNYTKGELKYRSLYFDVVTEDTPMEAVTVNNCTMREAYTRITNYSMMCDRGNKWRQVEYPLEYTKGVNEPYYPMGDNAYADMVPTERCLLLGRLAEFKYYDMDKVIAKVIKEIQCI